MNHDFSFLTKGRSIKSREIKSRETEGSTRTKLATQNPTSPPINLKLHQGWILPELMLREGSYSRDGSVIQPTPPIPGQLYRCLAVIHLEKKQLLQHTHQARLKRRLLDLLESLPMIFKGASPSTSNSRVYVLGKEGNKLDMTPILVHQSGQIAHYLMSGWSHEVYSCYQLKNPFQVEVLELGSPSY